MKNAKQAPNIQYLGENSPHPMPSSGLTYGRCGLCFMIWDIPSVVFPHQLVAVEPTSEAFPGLDVKEKKEKKEVV